MSAAYNFKLQSPDMDKTLEQRRFSISSETSVEQDSDSEQDILRSSEDESDEFEETSICSNYDFMQPDLSLDQEKNETKETKRSERVGIKRGRTFIRRSTNKENRASDSNGRKRTSSPHPESARAKRASQNNTDFDLKLATDELEAELARELEKVGIIKTKETEDDPCTQKEPSFLSFSFNDLKKATKSNFAVGSTANKSSRRKAKHLKEGESMNISDYLSKMKLESSNAEKELQEKPQKTSSLETSPLKSIFLDKMRKVTVSDHLPTPIKVTKSSLRRRKGLSTDRRFKSLKNSRKEKAVLKEQKSMPTSLLDAYLKENSEVLLAKMDSLLAEKKISDIVLLGLTVKTTDIVHQTVAKASLWTGHKPSFDVNEKLKQSFQRAESLHVRINKRLSAIELTPDSLSSLHLFLKELKTIEIKSVSTDFYTAVLLLLKIVSQNDPELNKKLKQNIRICLKNWIKRLPVDIACLFLDETYTKHTGLRHIFTLSSVVKCLLKNGFYQEVSCFLNDVFQCFNNSLLIQSLFRELYLHITTKDVDKFIERFNNFALGESVTTVQPAQSSKASLDKCQFFVQLIAGTLKDLNLIQQGLFHALKVKEEAKKAFVSGKKSAAKTLYTSLLEQDALNETYYKALKSVFYCNRAACFLSLSKFEQAAEDCTKAIQLDPTNFKAKIRKSKVLSKQYKFDEALDLLKTTLKQHPHEKSVLDRIRSVILEKDLHRQRIRSKNSIKKQASGGDFVFQELTVEEIVECEDYYKVLGVSRTATTAEIKKRYHKLALKYHPDKASDVDKKASYEEAFKKVSSCFEVLKDSSKRRMYDLQNGFSLFTTPTRTTYKKYETHGYYSCGSRATKFSKQYSYSGYSG